MSASGAWMTRTNDPLSARYLGRAIATTPPLSPFRLISAWFAGRADGMRGVLDAVDFADGTPVDTYWLHRNAAAFEQADRRQYLAMEARVAGPSRALASLARERRELSDECDSQRDALAELLDREQPTPSTIVRGAAEQSAHESVVLARRQRHWDRPVLLVRGRIESLEQRMHAIDVESAKLAAIIMVAHSVAVSRSQELRRFYERPAETYRRALSRSAVNGAVVQAAGINTVTLPVPAWTTEPCRWISSDYAITPTTRTTDTKESADVL